jgi:hypothetical protein
VQAVPAVGREHLGARGERHRLRNLGEGVVHKSHPCLYSAERRAPGDASQVPINVGIFSP